MEHLEQVLQIHKGVSAFIGGGGKTSTIYELAHQLSQKGHRVIVTTTTKMYIPRPDQVEILLIQPTIKEIEKAFLTYHCIGIAADIRENKILGVTEESIRQMKEIADYVLVEADGSKQLPLKVPGPKEPVIPPVAKHVIALVGMSCLGKSLENGCFRQEEARVLLDVDPTHIINTKDLVKIITDSNGLMKNVDNRKFTVLLNQMDLVKDKNSVKNLIRTLEENGINEVILASLKEKRWWKE